MSDVCCESPPATPDIGCLLLTGTCTPGVLDGVADADELMMMHTHDTESVSVVPYCAVWVLVRSKTACEETVVVVFLWVPIGRPCACAILAD